VKEYLFFRGLRNEVGQNQDPSHPDDQDSQHEGADPQPILAIIEVAKTARQVKIPVRMPMVTGCWRLNWIWRPKLAVDEPMNPAFDRLTRTSIPLPMLTWRITHSHLMRLK
jgi:hypothetical protein